MALLAAHWGGAAEKINLAVEAQVGDCQVVKMAVKTEGELRLNADGKEIQTLPLTVDAHFLYTEKLVSHAQGKRSAARVYYEAKADIQVGKTDITSELGAARLIVAEASGSGVSVFSPTRSITRDELDLIDVQGPSVALDLLLPTLEQEVGDTWEIGVESLIPLLRLDGVTESKVQGELTQVKDQNALIAVTGTVSGAVDGAGADLEINGKLNVDLDRQQITWVVLTLKETRAIGHAQPGYQTTSTIRVAMAPAKETASLRDESLSALILNANDDNQRLQFASRFGNFRFQYDRRWRLMVDRGEVSIFRMVDQGDLLAQLNISKLPKMESGKQLSMGEFEQTIGQSIGAGFEQLVESKQTETESGLRLLRCTAVGTVGDLPITWICCHVSDQQGRRVSCVFTMETKFAERFGLADEVILGSLAFQDPAARTAAKPAAESTEEDQR